MLLFFGWSHAQQLDSLNTVDQRSKWTLGGSVGLGGSFGGGGSSTALSLSPRLGYWLTPNLLAGLGTNFMWHNSTYFSSSIVGVGPYVNYFVIPNFYLSTSFEQYFVKQRDKVSHERFSTSEPALHFGLGYAQPIARGAYLQIGGSYNVLYKKHSSVFSSGFTPTIGIVLGL